MTKTLAVARYTLLEIGRRRLLLAIVAIGVVLTAAIAVTPHLLPGNDTNTKKLIVALTGLQEVVPTALLLCAFAIGMTVINHDLDSGAVVSIFAKPVSRASYTLGKLVAALAMLLLIAAIFTSGSLIDTALNGGSVYGVVVWTGLAQAANVVLLMLLVMTLTVYLNNIIAATIGFVFNYAASNVVTLYTMVQQNAITNSVGRVVIDVLYWVVPHHLTSDLERQIQQMRLDTRELVAFGHANAFAGIPGPSGVADVAFWLAYVVLICVLLFWSVRRKQV